MTYLAMAMGVTISAGRAPFTSELSVGERTAAGGRSEGGVQSGVVRCAGRWWAEAMSQPLDDSGDEAEVALPSSCPRSRASTRS